MGLSILGPKQPPSDNTDRGRARSSEARNLLCGPSLRKRIQNYLTFENFTKMYIVHANTLPGALQMRGLETQFMSISAHRRVDMRRDKGELLKGSPWNGKRAATGAEQRKTNSRDSVCYNSHLCDIGTEPF